MVNKMIRYYHITDKAGLIMDITNNRLSALKSIESLELSDLTNGTYRDGEYSIVHPNGMTEPIYNIWSETALNRLRIENKVLDGVTVP